MSELRQVAQQALEALEDMLGWQSLAPQTIQEAAKGRADALRAVLAEHYCDTHCTWTDHALGCVRAAPVQKPVAWIHADPDKPRVKFLEWREDEPGYRGRWIKTPLYTAP